MNSNRFTQNSIQAINSCERIAEEYGNTEIMPVHILYALMEKDGLIPRILSRSGTDCDGLTAAAKEEIESCPGALPAATYSSRPRRTEFSTIQKNLRRV